MVNAALRTIRFDGCRGTRESPSPVLVNLVGNAIRFNPGGEVTVRMGIDGGEPVQRSPQFEVADTGIGIGKETMALLFAAFQQVDAGKSRQLGSAGPG